MSALIPNYLGKYASDAAVNAYLSHTGTRLIGAGWSSSYVFSPIAGMVYRNVTTLTFRRYDGAAWVDIGGGGGVLTVDDEGVLVDANTTLMDFTGAGVTATQTAPGQVRVDVPGGGGGSLTGVVNPNGVVTGAFGQTYRDTSDGLWYKCDSNPSGAVWSIV